MIKAPRREGDFYPTPQALADKIVRHSILHVPGREPRILEPSAGSGVFVRACRDVWPKAQVIAIEPSAEHTEALKVLPCRRVESSLEDFYKATPLGYTFDLIIGNPPYCHAQEHVRLCLDMLAPHGVLVFLLRLGFLASKGRRALFDAHPPARMDVLPERPSFSWTWTCAPKRGGCGRKWVTEPGVYQSGCLCGRANSGPTALTVTKTDAHEYAVFTWRRGSLDATVLGWL